VNAFFEQIKAIFNRLSQTQKLLIGAAVLGVFILITVLIFMFGKSSYVPLPYTLDERGKAKLVKSLEEMGYSYKIKGSKIYVPESKLEKIKLSLAGADALPRSSVSWKDLIDKQSWTGTTRTVERLNIIRGLQGELETTISQLDPIETVRVHIVVPEEKLFEEDQEDSKASVFVKLRPLAKILPRQIKAIMNLVANAVPGLKPKNVEVISMEGEVLSDKIIMEGFGHEIGIRKQLEEDLRLKAQTLLNQVVGPGKAVVRVSAELDFDKIEKNIKQFTPPVSGEEKGVPISQKTVQEKYKGVSIPPKGVPGVKSNVPQYASKEEGRQSEYTRTDGLTNFVYNQQSERKFVAPGTIKRLTVSVVIDMDPAKVSKEQRNSLEEVVKNAVGYKNDRDSFAMSFIVFNKEHIKKMQAQLEQARKKQLETVMIIFTILAILILGIPITFKIINFIKQRKLRRAKELEEQSRLAARKKILEPVLSIEEQEKRDIQNRIKQHVIEKPEEVAQILRTWLAEE